MTQKLGILLFENVQPMDVMGPWEVFSFWKNALNPQLEMYLIAEHAGLVSCLDGIVLKAHTDFQHAPQLDFLVVPGGHGRQQAAHNEALLSFIKQQANHAAYTLSVCTGMFLLHQAGILKDQDITTYWRALPEAKTFSDVNVVGGRIVKNKRIWLAGGVSSGIDLALALIAEVAGEEAAGKVQLMFEYFPNAKVYGQPDLFKSLPPYNQQFQQAELPEYIEEYIRKKK